MIQAKHDLMPVVLILLLTGMAGSSPLFILRWPGNRRTHQHQDHQPVFQAEFDSPPSLPQKQSRLLWISGRAKCWLRVRQYLMLRSMQVAFAQPRVSGWVDEWASCAQWIAAFARMTVLTGQ